MAMSRAFGATLFTTRPPMAISPAEMFSRPAIIRSSVDLPQPDGPTRMTNSPSSISTSTPWSTSVTPNVLRTLRMETLAMVLLDVPYPKRRRGPPRIMPEDGHDACSELRNARLLGGDELQQRRLARLRLPDAAL